MVDLTASPASVKVEPPATPPANQQAFFQSPISNPMLASPPSLQSPDWAAYYSMSTPRVVRPFCANDVPTTTTFLTERHRFLEYISMARDAAYECRFNKNNIGVINIHCDLCGSCNICYCCMQFMKSEQMIHCPQCNSELLTQDIFRPIH